MFIKEGQERVFEDATADIMVSLNRIAGVSDDFNEALVACEDIWFSLCEKTKQPHFKSAFNIFIMTERDINIKELRKEMD